MKYFSRFLVLTVAFALTTVGLVAWHDLDFRLHGIWPLGGPPRLHPLHVMILGLAMIPPALWEVFLLDRRTDRRTK